MPTNMGTMLGAAKGVSAKWQIEFGRSSLFFVAVVSSVYRQMIQITIRIKKKSIPSETLDQSNAVVTAEKHPVAPSDDEQFLLYQIERNIRAFSFEDVNEILSYEDDNMPYALADKLEQNKNRSTIKVIKENLKKVKGYLEREKEKKQPSIFAIGYILKIIIAMIFIGVLLLVFYYIFVIVQRIILEVRINSMLQ